MKTLTLALKFDLRFMYLWLSSFESFSKYNASFELPVFCLKYFTPCVSGKFLLELGGNNAIIGKCRYNVLQDS